MKDSSFANILLPFATAILMVAHDSLFFATAENNLSEVTIDQKHRHIQDTPTEREMNDLCANISNQKDALLALKEGLIGNETTKLVNWVNTTDPCTWTGITCSGSNVTEISFESTDLVGTISPLIGCPPLVTSLTYLDFSGNSLSGSIPTEIGSLTSLTYLGLDGFNTLTGLIPTEIGYLTSLTYLDFDGNSLTGLIPTEIGSLTSLTYLDFAGNSLTGPIPTEIGSLTSLTYLDFIYNFFTGSIPTEIGSLTTLTFLDFYTNSLSGLIPTEIGYLSSLTYLGFDDNFLTGLIPTEIGSLTSLDYLNFGFNTLSGVIPSEIGSLTSLTLLVFEDNTLTSVIPTEIGSLTNLTYLSFGDNNLTGSIPAEICNILPMFEEFTYDTDEVEGCSSYQPTVLASVSPSSQPTVLASVSPSAQPTVLASVSPSAHQPTNDPCANISNQKDALLALKEGLIGNDTTKLVDWANTTDPCTWTGITCSGSDVTWIIVAFKDLVGTISPLIGCPPLVTSLTELDFVGNFLTGSIPTEIGSLTSLTYLHFESNTLTGSIPTEIGYLTNLTYLDFESNTFTGSIPTEIGSLTNLTWLDFDDNDLTGPIPEEICNLLPLSEKFTYDTDKVKGCPINVHSGASNEFSTYSLILFTCCVPLLVWELL